tara:strand:- start:851 stop:2938 length:2088 start_codon:yes stop_codon:yes gene_type:complete
MDYNYEVADEFIMFNDNDEDLRPIKYMLPAAPSFEATYGYGVAPEDQMWKPFEMPPKLAELNERSGLFDSEKIKILEAHQSYYQDEIEFIKTDWERRLNGMFLFINGKQYYISGDNYFYLNWWLIEGKNVQFRMRDRKWWLFSELIWQDPRSYGMNYPKHRREGATTRVTCKRFLIAASIPYARVGLQSKDDGHAAEVHKVQMVDQVRYAIPFWHRPLMSNLNMADRVLKLYAPSTQNHPDKGKKAMMSLIDFRDSGLKAYDGLKVKCLHNDEVGKTVEVNIKQRWEIQRQCLSEGSTIFGKSYNTSTVDEMEKRGGKVFKQLCDQSHYEKRLENNRTLSGLYNFFMPADEGFEGMYKDGRSFIDQYGMDVMDDDGVKLATKYHDSILDGYKAANDAEGYIEYTRQFPMRWKNCWRSSAKDSSFNMTIIEDRLDHYRNGNTDVVRGNFFWINNEIDTGVEFIPSLDGRFELSWDFPSAIQANQSYWEDGFKKPKNITRFVAGGDPFKFKLTKNGKKSMGAGCVYRYFDSGEDGNSDISQWKSSRFVCMYSARPKDKHSYGEDMIMMCVYFGCKMFPEINVDFLWEHFEARGYGGYLYFPIDPHTGKVSRQPGVNTGEKVKEEIFRELQYYIELHGGRERHVQLLEQCKDIEDDMGDYDLFVAAGLALIAAKNKPFSAREADQGDIEELFPTYFYN